MGGTEWSLQVVSISSGYGRKTDSIFKADQLRFGNRPPLCSHENSLISFAAALAHLTWDVVSSSLKHCAAAFPPSLLHHPLRKCFQPGGQLGHFQGSTHWLIVFVSIFCNNQQGCLWDAHKTKKCSSTELRQNCVILKDQSQTPVLECTTSFCYLYLAVCLSLPVSALSTSFNLTIIAINQALGPK